MAYVAVIFIHDYLQNHAVPGSSILPIEIVCTGRLYLACKTEISCSVVPVIQFHKILTFNLENIKRRGSDLLLVVYVSRIPTPNVLMAYRYRTLQVAFTQQSL
jgi:hypothetical protein